MHVALVHRDLHQLTHGGICTVYRTLAARMHARGAQVTLVTQQTPYPVQADGVAVEALPRTDDLSAHRQAVADTLVRLAPDVVECSTWEAEALAYLGRSERAPVLVRGQFSAATLGALDLARDEHDLVHAANRVIAVSDFAARDLAAEYAISTPTVVANGIDRTRFRPGSATAPTGGFRVTLDQTGVAATREPLRRLLDAGVPVAPWWPDPDGRLRLVWVGKITPMKGWDLLEAAARGLREIAAITVLLGHSRAYSPFTLDSATDLTVVQDLDDADLPGFYRAADWLLSTSRWEGFGLAIGEALACGTPVLLPEQLGTAPELLAEGGGHIYRDIDDLAHLLTRENHAVAHLPQRFDWDINAEATLALYRGLIQDTSRPCVSC